MSALFWVLLLFAYPVWADSAGLSVSFDHVTADWPDRNVREAGFLHHSPQTLYLLTEQGQLFLYHTESRKLTRERTISQLGYHITSPIWSSDGRRVAFTLLNERLGKIYIYNYNNKSVVTLSTGIEHLDCQIWVRAQELICSTGYDSYLVSVPSGYVKRISGLGTGGVAEAFTNVGGGRLFFSRSGETFPSFLIYDAPLLDSAIRDPRKVFYREAVGGEVRFSVSRDGKYMAISELAKPRDSISRAHVLLVEVASGKYVELPLDEAWDDNYAFISPDASGIVVLSRRAQQAGKNGAAGPGDSQRIHVRYAKLDPATLDRWFAQYGRTR